MDPHSSSCYVSSLERQIQSLHLILKEWAAYVPQDVILKSRISFVVNPQVSPLESSQSSLSSQRQKTLPPSPPEPEEAWRKTLISFIKKIPTAKNWFKAISSASLDTESLSSPSILQSLLKEPGQIEGGLSSVPVIQRQHTNILHTLESYALLTQKCEDSAKLAKLIASYQKFLFVALCHVACCVGIDENVVNKMMGSISNGNPEHLRQMRLAAAWGVAAVDRLQCKSKWGMRSGDILFYFTPSFYSLRNIAKGKQSIDVFTTSLCQSQYTEISARLPKLHMNNLSVPCIIKCIFGKTVQLSEICKSLRADLNAARDIFTRWYLEPFGSNAFDEQELSSLFSPMITVSPRTQWGTGPGGGMINLAEDVRKRRRTDNGAGSPTTEKTPSGLDSQSTIDTPGPTISTDALTVVDDDQISPRPCPSTYVNADFGDISQQSAREHSVLAAGTGLQLIDERQIGWPVPQAQDYSNHVPPLSARSPDTADVQALAYSVPSFNAISAIPFLPDSPFPVHSSPLPSSSLEYCIPSFSQITGIPSPV